MSHVLNVYHTNKLLQLIAENVAPEWWGQLVPRTGAGGHYSCVAVKLWKLIPELKYLAPGYWDRISKMLWEMYKNDESRRHRTSKLRKTYSKLATHAAAYRRTTCLDYCTFAALPLLDNVLPPENIKITYDDGEVVQKVPRHVVLFNSYSPRRGVEPCAPMLSESVYEACYAIPAATWVAAHNTREDSTWFGRAGQLIRPAIFSWSWSLEARADKIAKEYNEAKEIIFEAKFSDILKKSAGTRLISVHAAVLSENRITDAESLYPRSIVRDIYKMEQEARYSDRFVEGYKREVIENYFKRPVAELYAEREEAIKTIRTICKSYLKQHNGNNSTHSRRTSPRPAILKQS